MFQRTLIFILVIFWFSPQCQHVESFLSNSTRSTFEDELESRNIILRTKCGGTLEESRGKCNGHGTCGVNPFGTYGPNFLAESDPLLCKCDPGYYGTRCQFGPVCLPGSTCSNGGSCVAIFTESAIYQKCLCPVGNGNKILKDTC